MSRPDERGKGHGNGLAAAVAAVAVLDDPTRRTIYRYVTRQSAPVSREQTAAALGVPHHVARFNLDRLEAAGLVEAHYERPEGRGGPGGGRPTKLYRPADTEFAVTLPERRYELAGLVLSRSIASASESGRGVSDTLVSAARDFGKAAGRAAVLARGRLCRREAMQLAVEVLDSYGFEPAAIRDGYVLRNCPFLLLAREEPEVVCRMNLALVGALLEELGAGASNAQLDPGEGRCCVTVGLRGAAGS